MTENSAVLKIIAKHTKEYNELSAKYTELLSDMINLKTIIVGQERRIVEMEFDIVEDLKQIYDMGFISSFEEVKMHLILKKWEALKG